MKKVKILSALWTPTDESGKLLKDDLKVNLKFLEDKGVDGLLVAGSTGEFHYLKPATRKDLLKCVIDDKGSMDVLFNVSHTDPKVVKDFINFANPLDISGITLLPPLFYPFARDDLIEYFVDMSKLIKHPFYLYTFPELVGYKLELDVIQEICKRVPVAGIKYSGADFTGLTNIMNWAHDKDFKVFSGNDILLPESLQQGVFGGIGGLVNALPELFVAIKKAVQSNDNEKIKSLSNQLKQLPKLLDRLKFPLNVSALMESRNLAIGSHKMPMSKTTSETYEEVVKEATELFQGWNLM
ncbi:MAG: dihydrodipicolinate synthase family protein [Parachlamydiales bacterium]|nr:dihydrodipicolinate synthase family protein [Parachlamydiales bacterium]